MGIDRNSNMGSSNKENIQPTLPITKAIVGDWTKEKAELRNVDGMMVRRGLNEEQRAKLKSLMLHDRFNYRVDDGGFSPEPVLESNPELESLTKTHAMFQKIPLDGSLCALREDLRGQPVRCVGQVLDNKIVITHEEVNTPGRGHVMTYWMEGCKLHMFAQDREEPEVSVSCVLRKHWTPEEPEEKCSEVDTQLEESCPEGPLERDHTDPRVLELLEKEWPKDKNTSLSNTWQKRDEFIRNTGPAMVLMDPADIAELGRIPVHSERRFITMTEAKRRAEARGMRFFVDFFSHRWHKPTQPDDDHNSQAKALVEWGKFRAANGLATFFWIDYSCVDQTNVASGIAMLPLYIATSNNIVCFSGTEYEIRAWCRLERAMFAAFGAPTQDFISEGFTFSGDPEQQPVEEGYKILQDPEGGQLSFAVDVPKVAALNSIAKRHWRECWKVGLFETVRGHMECVDTLVYGATQVRNRRFN